MEKMPSSPIEKKQTPEYHVNNQETYLYLQEYINLSLLEDFKKDFIESGFSSEQVTFLFDKISQMNLKEQQYFFSIPWSMRQKYFAHFLKKLSSGSTTLDTFFDPLIESSKKIERKTGYHCTKTRIFPSEQRVGPSSVIEKDWAVMGFEQDHRNNDLPMAYYSTDLHKLYFEKNPNYLYLIAYSTQAGSGHYPDNDGSWGRASKLDIISEVDLKKFRTYIEDKQKTTGN